MVIRVMGMKGVYMHAQESFLHGSTADMQHRHVNVLTVYHESQLLTCLHGSTADMQHRHVNVLTVYHESQLLTCPI